MNFFDRIMEHLNPAPNPDLESASCNWEKQLPTLWLLGKTGAGKSSLIQALTGDEKVEIGNGFRPCTMSSVHYDFPIDKPILRFLDTRGLAEADYDAEEDIRYCEGQSHALIIVMKADEPEQSSVLQALEQIKKAGTFKQLLLVHTAVCSLDASDRERCIGHNRDQVTKTWKDTITEVSVDFELDDGGSFGVDDLKTKLSELMPIIAQLNTDQSHSSQEESNFNRLKTEVLWYSGTAGASDAIPGVGLVSVPVIQAKMLHSLGNQYDVEWDKASLAEFTGALGTGFAAQYLGKLGIRQLVKLIPIYGQTVGAATAAAMSFGTTYALGRVACVFLYHKNKGEPVPEAQMQKIFKNAFDSIREVAEHETRHK